MLKSLVKTLAVLLVLFAVAVLLFHGKRVTSTASGAAGERLEIYYMYHEDESQSLWLKAATKKFEEMHPGLTVDILFAGREVLGKLRPRMIIGNPPDIVNQGGDQLRVLQDDELFEQLDGELNTPAWNDTAAWKDTFIPGVIDIYIGRDKETAGHYYQIPTSVFCDEFFYNIAQFEKLGLKTPKTWTEFLHVCQVLKDNGIEPLAADGTETGYNVAWYTVLMTRTTNIKHVRATAYNEPGTSWKEKCFLDAAKLVRELRDKGYIMQGYEGSKWPSAQMQWVQGRCGILYNGTWIPKEMKNKLPDGFRMGIFRFPIVEGYPEADSLAQDIGADCFAIPKGARHKELAIEFLKLVTSKEQAVLLSQADVPCTTKGVPMPPSLAGLDELLSPPYKLYESYGITNDLSGWYRNCARENWSNLFLGHITPEEMIDDLQAKQERYYERMKLLADPTRTRGAGR